MRKNLIFILVPVLFMACQGPSKSSKERVPREVPSYSIEQFMDNESVFGGSFSQDKSKVLISSNKTGIFNIYTVDVASGTTEEVTASDSSSIFSISFFPNDDRVLFRMDGNGDEIYHIYVREEDGTSKDLTPFEGARAIFYGWAHDRSGFYFGSNKRNPRITDVYKMELDGYTTSMIYQNDENYNFNDISRDESYMAFSKSINTNDSDLFVYSVEDKTMAKVNENQSGNSAADFNPDGTALMYVTDDGSEFSKLMKYEIASAEVEEVVAYDWDIYNFYYTRGGKYTVTLINEDARNKLMVVDNESGDEVSFPDFENGSITNISFSRDESMATFYVGSSGMPTNLYVYDLASKELTQLTNTLNKEIASEDLVIAQNIRYKSFDELEIPAIYYLPHEASVDNKVPALVWVHGGPGGQSRQNFNSLIQFMVNHGYAVLAVNNRGSSGYGKTFYKMDDKNHGDKDLKDCVEGKNWLAQQPEIDPEKIGIIGGSYGGFMTMAALTSTPEEFNVGVNLFGVTNWIRTLKSIPPWWESFKDALYLEMGDPYTDDSVRLYNISPLFHADKVTKPLIVLQGSQDPRVLQVESDEIVENVKANGVPVEYVLFEDEGHGFVKKENQIEAYSAILTFLDRYLKGEDPEEVSMNTN